MEAVWFDLSDDRKRSGIKPSDQPGRVGYPKPPRF